jgi:hypothetical protein
MCGKALPFRIVLTEDRDSASVPGRAPAKLDSLYRKAIGFPHIKRQSRELNGVVIK